jgi:hypothetical protein
MLDFGCDCVKFSKHAVRAVVHFPVMSLFFFFSLSLESNSVSDPLLSNLLFPFVPLRFFFFLILLE